MKNYPFAAIIGQPKMKLALLLAGVDWRLSVLLKGIRARARALRRAPWPRFFR